MDPGACSLDNDCSLKVLNPLCSYIGVFTVFQLVGAAFGAAGQRCMALTTAIFVGESKEWIPDLVAKAKELQVNEGNVSQHKKCLRVHCFGINPE